MEIEIECKPDYSDLADACCRTSDNKYVGVVRPEFVDVLDGDIYTAMFLNQIMFWVSVQLTKCKKDTFYKTDKDWWKEIRLSKRSVTSCKKKLTDLGIIETFIKKHNGNPVTHYKVNKDRLGRFLHRVYKDEHSLVITKNVQTNDTGENTESLVITKNVQTKLQKRSEPIYRDYDSKIINIKSPESKTFGSELPLKEKPSYNLFYKIIKTDPDNLSDTEYAAQYFFSTYERYMKKKHPPIKDSQIQYGLEQFEEHNIDWFEAANLKNFVNSFFKCERLQNSDFRWNLFVSENVIQARAYERYK